MKSLKEMEQFIKTNKYNGEVPTEKDSNNNLEYYMGKEIVIKTNEKLFKRILQWDKINNKFFVEYNKKAYEVTRDYLELPTIFIMTNEIV
jgi:hypothetical protein